MVTTETLFAPEDKYVGMSGLYFLWTSLFIADMAVLCTDSTSGNPRDFNVLVSLISTLFVGFASYNTVYGTKLPSTMMLVMGPLYLYSYWTLLAYYQGDVYGDHSLGKLNIAYTVISGLFSVDMVVKTWYLTLFPDNYNKYISAENTVKLSP